MPRHFVQYHKSEKMGYGCDEVDDLVIYTSKDVRRLPGSIVWVVCGQGRRRRYYLAEVFLCDDAGSVEDSPAHEEAEFLFYASGVKGMRFGKSIELGELVWFRALKNQTGNFGFGLTEITERRSILSALTALIPAEIRHLIGA